MLFRICFIPTEQSDLIIPIAKLFQGNPTEADKYPEARGGQVINSLTQDLLEGSFVPIFKRTEVVKFNGKKVGDDDFDPAYKPGALIWKTSDPNDPKWKCGDWGENGEKPTAMRCMNFLCLFEGQPMPLLLRFSRTSYRAGKTLLSLAQFSGGNMFDRKYKLGSKKEDSDGNIYYIFTVQPIGESSDEQRAQADLLYDSLCKSELKAHDEVHEDFEE